jgi:hypothetical protein
VAPSRVLARRAGSRRRPRARAGGGLARLQVDTEVGAQVVLRSAASLRGGIISVSGKMYILLSPLLQLMRV